ncbi:hypothetical protein A5680_07635 [Mycobacterium sp. E2989]|nr:hypothetical protein A5680_07635 [Mycobacterium sp. E2989]
MSQASICSARRAAIRRNAGNRSQSASDTSVMSAPSGVLPGILISTAVPTALKAGQTLVTALGAVGQ